MGDGNMTSSPGSQLSSIKEIMYMLNRSKTYVLALKESMNATGDGWSGHRVNPVAVTEWLRDHPEWKSTEYVKGGRESA